MVAYDQIIVGQGIAGSVLAWQLCWSGQRVAVIDHPTPTSASRVASGLISPIAGKRNAASWRFPELWDSATAFYARVESETHTDLLVRQPMLRIVAGDDDVPPPSATPFAGNTSPLDAPLNDQLMATEFLPAGRLAVLDFLRVTEEMLRSRDAFFPARVDPNSDVVIDNDGVTIPALSIRASRLVFCQGIAARDNPWFREVVFEPSKGEILTLAIPELAEQRVIHHEVWLAPNRDGTFLAGATYDRENLNTEPDDAARREILDKVATFCPVVPEVIKHQAAIRPTIRRRHPVAGISYEHPQLAFFNGLGSKGALRAPFVAQQLVNLLVHNMQLDAEIDLQKHRSAANAMKVTALAHQYVAAAVRPGDSVVDATAGNGFDTLFLSQLVGPNGKVYAFDIQEEAIVRTSRRLAAAKAQNVALLLASHAEMKQELPQTLAGEISAIMFNLGYLPRGDKSMTTTTDSSVRAVAQAMELLAPDGLMTIIAYTGHPGGQEEADAVLAFLESTTAKLTRPTNIQAAQAAPELFVVQHRH